MIHIEPGVDPRSEQMVHRNIRIEDNLFVQGKEAVLFADHTGEIRFCGNVIWAGGGQESPGTGTGQEKPDDGTKQGSPRVVLRNCRDVRMKGNEIIDFPDRYLQAEFSGDVYEEKVILR